MMKFNKVKFLILGLFTIILSSCLTPLTPDEIVKLKENETFWKWNSPSGPLDIHYIERGSGDKHIVLVHGFGAHTFTWRYLIDPLAKAGYHVWSIDLIGSGLSDKPYNVDYNIELFIAQLKSFMDEKSINRATFIGNSMGGGVSLATTLSLPDRVNSLVLIDPLGYPLDLPLYLKVPKMAGKAGGYFFGRWSIKWALSNSIYDQSKISEQQIDSYLYPFRMPGGDSSFIALLENFDNQLLERISSRYKEIDKPLLVIWGKEDKVIPLENLAFFKRDFPQAEFIVIPECGHMPQEECPEIVIKNVLKFLNSKQQD